MSSNHCKESTATIAACCLAILFLLGCSNPAAPVQGDVQRTLTVFAAASLTESFQQLADAFEKDFPGGSVAFHFAGSQRLRTQLEHGARADVFASADWRQMEAVEASSLLLGQPADFATNRLVVVLAAGPNPESSQGREKGSPARDELGQPEGLEYLAKPGVKLVLAAPEAPAGAYARQAIEALGDGPGLGTSYPKRVMDNLVSQETNVRHVLQKVSLGEADAGIVYQTDAGAGYAGRVRMIPIPDQFNITALYPIAVLKDTSQPELAQSFVQFVLGQRGQEILESHGFGRAPGAETPGQPAAPPAR